MAVRKFLKLFDKKFLKFLLVGAINTLTGVCVIWAAYRLFNLGYWLSTAAGTTAGCAVSYFLNKRFTFLYRRAGLAPLFKFILAQTACWFASYFIAKNLTRALLQNFFNDIKVIEQLSILAGMCLFVLLNYLSQALFVFKRAD